MDNAIMDFIISADDVISLHFVLVKVPQCCESFILSKIKS